MPSLWDDFVNSQMMRDYVSPAWNRLTNPLFEIPKTGEPTIDRLTDLFVPNSLLGIALIAAPAMRAGKYLKKGITEVKPVPGNVALKGSEIAPAIRDELKQIALTSGVPGTAINSFSVSQAAAHLKGTPL